MSIIQSTALPSTSSEAPPQSSSVPVNTHSTQNHVLRDVMGGLFCLLTFSFIGFLFYYHHRIRRGKTVTTDEQSTRATSIIGRIRSWPTYLRSFFGGRNAAVAPQVELTTLPRASTFPPLPSRRSSFDQRLPAYDPGEYVPPVPPLPIAEENKDS